MTRDFIGYGRKPPEVRWPGGARLALSFCINYEEGAEKSIEEGDEYPERFSELPYGLNLKIRDLAVESMYEYGSRVGFWRVLNLFNMHGIKTTFFACARALERNPEAAKEITRTGHEACSHGERWDEHFLMTREEERRSIRAAVQSLERTTGQRPVGWYCRYGPGIYTRELLAEQGFLYDSDSYADDLPYFVKVKAQDFLVLPYTLDVNDFQFYTNRFSTADEFYQYAKDSFDYLYQESESTARMFSIGLHLRIIGRPGRIGALEKLIAYIRRFPEVWIARRVDIANWWIKHFRTG
jgi:peptidoglycan/xylan/chitin deacetylase (PgdA/CDA1 family)